MESMLFAPHFKLPVRMVFVLVAFAILIGVYASGLDKLLTVYLHSLGILGTAFTGLFYTFGLTTPTAMLILLEMMRMNGAIATAAIGALAAAAVDTTLFLFLRDTLEENTADLMGKIHKRFGKSNLLILAGFFMFGTPVPDEIALASMQLGEIRAGKIFLIVFLAKFITLLCLYYGIYNILKL
jgi:hypothetical protein